MVPLGAEQLCNWGICSKQESWNEFWVGEKQGAQDAMGLQQNAHWECQESYHSSFYCLLNQPQLCFPTSFTLHVLLYFIESLEKRGWGTFLKNRSALKV